MNKELKYTGHTASPADYECPDGELSILMDLWPENGSLRPILLPSDVAQLSADQKVLYVHSVLNQKNYIVFGSVSNTLHYIIEGETPVVTHVIDGSRAGITAGNLIQINAVGNTLVFLTTGGMRYFIWKDNSYSYIGADFPELDISFGLQANGYRYPETYKETPAETDGNFVRLTEAGLTDSNKYEVLSESHQKVITDTVLAKVNKFIADHSVNDGKFMFPFLVRYAYRLFDGSLTRHSAPILMMCANDTVPLVGIWYYHHVLTAEDIDAIAFNVHGVSCELDYKVAAVNGQTATTATINETLGQWSDIIKSVDIFISAPLYTYNQAGKITNIVNRDTMHTLDGPSGIFKLNNAIWTQYRSYYQNHNIADTYGEVFLDGNNIDYFRLPSKDLKDGLDNAQFYFLKSYSLEEISTSISRQKIDIPKEYLPSLVNREVMTDDYDSHDHLVPNFSFSYNQRLNLTDISKTVFNGFNPVSLFCHSDGYVSYPNDRIEINSNPAQIRCYVQLLRNGKTITVASDNTNAAKGAFGYGGLRPYFFFFYPSTSAKKLTIVTTYNGTEYRQELTLGNHPFLNGSFCSVKDFNLLRDTAYVPTISSDATIPINNKIYTSEVGNPFLFPVALINTIGTGRIMAVSTAAKPLSQGQFGQFPLYAFTSDGVWALEVSTQTGGFSARQPITRDVCLSPESIQQVDDAVLFATDRGVMFIIGSNTACISEVIDTKEDVVFSLDQLPYAEDILVGAGNTDPSLDLVPFRTFLLGSRMMYDYTSQRYIIYNPSYRYAYIYSTSTKLWAMMRCNVVNHTNSYPQCLAMTTDNKLVDYSGREPNITPANQILVTRPLKLSDPDELKTVVRIIQRGTFAKGNVQTILYGSRDLSTWIPIFSSTDHYLRGFQGDPYKYFRIVLKCSLADSECLYGSSVEFNVRQIDQMR